MTTDAAASIRCPRHQTGAAHDRAYPFQSVHPLMHPLTDIRSHPLPLHQTGAAHDQPYPFQSVHPLMYPLADIRLHPLLLPRNR
ncbi:MAG: hypothetical protein NZM11_10050 [Anaerolineales bacterium]|nr:hypothetical protein [Anaerolineales bacterium]